MDYKKMYLEEDLFPREITCFIEKDYGILFYNDDNKDSFDSNHAIIYRNKISDLSVVLQDIIRFYKGKGITPNIYQSISDGSVCQHVCCVSVAEHMEVKSFQFRYMLGC